MIMPQRLGGFHEFSPWKSSTRWPAPAILHHHLFSSVHRILVEDLFFSIPWRTKQAEEQRFSMFFLVYGKLAASKGFQYLPDTTLIWKILQVSESTGLLSWGPPVFQAVASIQKPHIKSQLSDQLLSSFCPPNLTSASSRRRSSCKDLNDRKRRVWTLWDWTISIQFKCLSNETLKCPSTHLDT